VVDRGRPASGFGRIGRLTAVSLQSTSGAGAIEWLVAIVSRSRLSGNALAGPAKFELNEAAQYYESESLGLGQAFITAVERCTDDEALKLRAVREHPIGRDLYTRFKASFIDTVLSCR
jgi:hypothetical protein